MDGNHGRVVASGILLELRNFANDVKAGIPPEVALDKPHGVNSELGEKFNVSRHTTRDAKVKVGMENSVHTGQRQ